MDGFFLKGQDPRPLLLLSSREETLLVKTAIDFCALANCVCSERTAPTNWSTCGVPDRNRESSTGETLPIEQAESMYILP